MLDATHSDSFGWNFFPAVAMHSQQIQQSHARCRQFGLHPKATRVSEGTKLSPDQLKKRINALGKLFDVAVERLSALASASHDSNCGFVVADKDGFILHMAGDAAMLTYYEEVRCVPGYQWVEQTAGTCAVGLALAEKHPVFVTGREAFCSRKVNTVNIACPIVDMHGNVAAIVAGTFFTEELLASSVDTIMLATEVICNSWRKRMHSEACSATSAYSAIMDSDPRGILLLKRDGSIIENNTRAQSLLGLDTKLAAGTDSESEQASLNISSITATKINWLKRLQNKSGFRERSITFRRGTATISLLCSLSILENSHAAAVLFIKDSKQLMASDVTRMQPSFTFESIIGTSQLLRQAKKVALTTAQGNASVLLQGETGTGKELFAQSIHNASPRSNNPFIVINCGAIPRELFESELFGYVDGAFTGAQKGGRPGKIELVNGGTLFLDEIGDMPLDMQVKILRTLQSGEITRVGDVHPITVDLRVIVATNIDLDEAVREGAFREDLYYRINTIRIDVPPLRARGNDVFLLAEKFLTRIASAHGREDMFFGAKAKEALQTYPWPGNIRQLENTVERAVNMAEQNEITLNDLSLKQPRPLPDDSTFDLERIINMQGLFDFGTEAGDNLIERMEMLLIKKLLKEKKEPMEEVAKKLGISRPTLYRKIKRYKLN